MSMMLIMIYVSLFGGKVWSLKSHYWISWQTKFIFLTLYIYHSCPYLQLDKHIIYKNSFVSLRIKKDMNGSTRMDKYQQGPVLVIWRLEGINMDWQGLGQGLVLVGPGWSFAVLVAIESKDQIGHREEVFLKRCED